MKKHEVVTYQSTSRLEAFSDGVFAIIITIMVLEIKIPQLAHAFTTEDFFAMAEKLWPKLLSYAMSFLIVGIYWVNHFNFVHSMKHTDSKFLWWNNNLLFWLSLIPIPTAFLGEHSRSPWAVAAFGLVMFMCGVSFSLLSNYAMNTTNLMKEHLSQESKKRGFYRSLIGNVLYGLAILLAPVSIYISWVIFFLVPLIYFMPQEIQIENIFD